MERHKCRGKNWKTTDTMSQITHFKYLGPSWSNLNLNGLSLDLVLDKNLWH